MALLLLTSCVDKNDCNSERKSLVLSYNWSRSGPQNRISDRMEVLFYPSQSVGPLAYNVSAIHLSPLPLPAGNYRVITFPDNPSGIYLDSMARFETAQCYLKPIGNSQGSVVVGQPGVFYGAALDQLEISQLGVNNVVIYPISFTKKILIVLDQQGRTDAVVSCDGVLSNMATRYLFSQYRIIPRHVGSMAFTMESVAGVLVGSIRCFGKDSPAATPIEPTPSSANILKLHYKLINGSEGDISVDISSSLAHLNDPNVESIEVHIAITGTDVGIDATLSDWNVATSGNGTVIAQR